MSELTRRDVLKTGTALAMAGGLLSFGRRASAQELVLEPEPGASLHVLRWESFVAGDSELWQSNTGNFAKATGVSVDVEYVPWQAVREKAATVADRGSGPDIVFGWYDDPHLFHDRLVPLTDVAVGLGAKYGDWYPVCKQYATGVLDEWIALPLGVAGSCVVYRASHVAAAGFEVFPTDTGGFLKLCQTLAENGTPPGFVLGRSIGDASVFAHWALWAFGGKLVDLQGWVVIDSAQTLAALEYARELYQTFVPGTTAWLDADNNEAFLAGRISLTGNGVSIYYAAKNATDPAMQAIADDIQHANFPVGPVGSPTELFLISQAMVFNHTPYPNAAKAYLQFMWEREQYERWQRASLGYVTQPLRAYEDNPVWSQDPRVAPYRDCTARMLWNGYAGPLGTGSAAAMLDYIVVDMVAQAASGAKSPREAMREAERLARRYYRLP
ncbi:MAG: extracellular solute-binding protein [Rhodospirillales bacterium]|nr:extracellular solute-binding protein [Rhodospirillales bacterium]